MSSAFQKHSIISTKNMQFTLQKQAHLPRLIGFLVFQLGLWYNRENRTQGIIFTNLDLQERYRYD